MTPVERIAYLRSLRLDLRFGRPDPEAPLPGQLGLPLVAPDEPDRMEVERRRRRAQRRAT